MTGFTYFNASTIDKSFPQYCIMVTAEACVLSARRQNSALTLFRRYVSIDGLHILEEGSAATADAEYIKVVRPVDNLFLSVICIAVQFSISRSY